MYFFHPWGLCSGFTARFDLTWTVFLPPSWPNPDSDSQTGSNDPFQSSCPSAYGTETVKSCHCGWDHASCVFPLIKMFVLSRNRTFISHFLTTSFFHPIGEIFPLKLFENPLPSLMQFYLFIFSFRKVLCKVRFCGWKAVYSMVRICCICTVSVYPSCSGVHSLTKNSVINKPQIYREDSRRWHILSQAAYKMLYLSDPWWMYFWQRLVTRVY